jgi:shikimate dehydrogenase
MVPPIDAHTQIVGLLGYPVRHSLSPAMHNAAFATAKLNWRYHAFSVAPDKLEDAVKGLAALGIRGVNATIPHKEALLELVDDCTVRARTIGAINTIKISSQGRILGDNTDAPGFIEDLKRHKVTVSDHKALVLGAGGSSRAVVYGLLEAGSPKIHIVNRTLERARALAEHMNACFEGQKVSAGSLDAKLDPKVGFELVINTTSVGLGGKFEQESPWPDHWQRKGLKIAYDLIYNPVETPFLREFREQNCQAINGLGMLAEQGQIGWSWWTGLEASAEVMHKALAKKLSRNQK